MNEPAERQAEYLADAKDLLQGLRHGGVAIWRWRVDGEKLLWTDNLETLHGPAPTSYDSTVESFQRDLHPEDADRVWSMISNALRAKKSFRTVYRTRPDADGSFRWIEARGGLATESGENWLTGICLDVTDRVQAERELQRRLRQQKAIEELGSFAIDESNLQVVASKAATIAAEVLEVPFTKILRFTKDGERLLLFAGTGWREGLVGSETVGIGLDSQAGFTLSEGKPIVVENLATEIRFNGPELLRSHGVVSGMSTIIAGEGARPFGVFGVHTNASRRFDQADTDFLTALANIIAHSARQIAAVEHRALLVREMAHRAGNMLQLVDTLANRIFLPDCDLDEAKRSFSSRLGSLSRANYLVARGGWSLTRFTVLVEEALEPFRERVRLDGEDVLLPPELCFDLGLVLHELSTNAVKYGSFASEQGTVDIRWSLRREADEKEMFHFEWMDNLSSKPKRESGTGFGSRLMHLIIERKWGGEIEPAAPKGYRFAFALPIASAPKTIHDE